MKWFNRFLVILPFAVFTTSSNGQDLVKNLENWEASNPIEKLYVQTDRNTYYAGQTIWLKSYFLKNYQPSQSNSTLFLELLNSNSQIILKKVLPVFNSITYGQLEIPDSLSTGTYWLRAYSPLMLNFNKNYLFKSALQVFGKNQKNIISDKENRNKIFLQFFPEGGNLLLNTTNNIAFKAINGEGIPVNISGTITNTSNHLVETFNTYHDGMGAFNLIPEPGEKYFAVTDDGQKFELPPAQENGIALRAHQNKGQIEFTISTENLDSKFLPATCLAQMQNKVVQQPELVVNGNIFSGKLITSHLKSGILQLTIFNKDNMPLAERLFFINNKEYRLNATLNPIQFSDATRKRNQLEINLPTNVEGNFSISVTDADYDIPGSRSENIISSMLLTNDLPGYVHNPSWYFSDDEKSPQAMDLLMLTNGWRRFNWLDVANKHLPKPTYTDPGYITLAGQADVRGSKKNFANRELLMWMTSPTSGPNLKLLKTDDEGKFRMDSIVFFDKAKILFSDVLGKKSKFITVKLNTDSLYKTYNLPPLNVPVNNNIFKSTLRSKMQSAYFDYSVGEGLLLDNVSIEGRKLTENELEKKYMSGLFAGGINARTFNLTGEFIPQWNIFDWLIGRVPSLQLNKAGYFGDDYRLFYRQQPIQLFLDEMPMQDASFITSIPANQFALIKIYPQFIGARGNGSALAVYTKRGDDIVENIESTGEILDYDGYSIIKEYYSPNYSLPAETNYKDYRLTLNWQPEVLLNGNSKIPVSFYNNDRTKRFKVVAEGITNDGKLLMFEKIIEPGKY